MMAPRYREEQAFRQWWIWLLILAAAALQWWGFYQQIVLGEAWGSNPAPDWMMIALWLGVGIGLPFFFWYMRLVVTVSEESIDIHYRPLIRRRIPVAEIDVAEARRYSPLSEYGGWGIRRLSTNKAYNVSGNRAVQFLLADGSRVLVGSQRADDLALAIAAAMESQQRRRPESVGSTAGDT